MFDGADESICNTLEILSSSPILTISNVLFLWIFISITVDYLFSLYIGNWVVNGDVIVYKNNFEEKWITCWSNIKNNPVSFNETAPGRTSQADSQLVPKVRRMNRILHIILKNTSANFPIRCNEYVRPGTWSAWIRTADLVCTPTSIDQVYLRYDYFITGMLIKKKKRKSNFRSVKEMIIWRNMSSKLATVGKGFKCCSVKMRYEGVRAQQWTLMIAFHGSWPPSSRSSSCNLLLLKPGFNTKCTSRNTRGTPVTIWNKIMKTLLRKERRYKL